MVPLRPAPPIPTPVETAEAPESYIIHPRDHVLTNIGSVIKNSKRKVEWSFEFCTAKGSTNHLICLLHSVTSMRVRLFVDNKIRHSSQQRKGVPKWVYQLTLNGLKCAVVVDYSKTAGDIYELSIDGVQFKDLGFKPGSAGSPLEKFTAVRNDG